MGFESTTLGKNNEKGLDRLRPMAFWVPTKMTTGVDIPPPKVASPTGKERI